MPETSAKGERSEPRVEDTCEASTAYPKPATRFARPQSENPTGPTCQKIEDLIAHGRPMIERWPGFYRHTLGKDIYSQMLTMLRLATKTRLKHYGKTTLNELDCEKELLLCFLRQANKTEFTDRSGQKRKLLSDHSYAVWAEKVVEIGRMIGGWMNSIQKGQLGKGGAGGK